MTTPDGPRSSPASRGRGPRPEPFWAAYSDEELLGLRFRDLRLSIRGTELEHRIRDVNADLGARGLVFRPHFWLSDEWFTPDGVAGVAIPFYLGHPRLMKLEEKMMLEVEGGTRDWCLRILRHEVGHAIDNAYRLHRLKAWRQVFGKASVPYPDFYMPKPFSKRFVLHLDSWYAQSHPVEDFAETFAVWLTPGFDWRARYKGWPALKKLEYVDALMAQIAGHQPKIRKRTQVDHIRNLSKTLGEHYAEKRSRYGTHYPDFYDRDLRKLFSDAPEHAGNELAARFLRRHRREILLLVARWTGEYQYRIDRVFADMTQRCRELRLRLARGADETRMEAAILLTVQTMNYLHSGHHQIVM
ncbi:MAG: hypothetical protein DCC65_05730 [Planctomycetota bacterium]|nr:MAG: hypothetical protein DCC65_05730 [Planctomycetota bacterium]